VKPLIALVVVLSIAVVATLAMRTYTAGGEERFQASLWQAKQLDGNFKQDLLRMRFSLLSTYDNFEANKQAMHEALDGLQSLPAFVSDGGRSRILAALQREASLIDQRSQLVERFKSQNAVVTNSRRYLPIAVGELQSRLGKSAADIELGRATAELSRVMLISLSNNDADLDVLVNDATMPLRAWLERHPQGRDVSAVRTLLRHARTLLTGKARLESLTAELVSLPTTEVIEQLSGLYEHEVSASLGRARSYRTALYGVGGLLMVLVLGTLLGLRATNARLEQRVLERTHALAGSEMRFRTLATAAPIGIFQTDAQGQVIYTNPHWSAISGMPAEAALGEGWHIAVHPADAASVRETWAATAREGTGVDREFRFLRPDGTERIVHARSAVVRDERSGIAGHVGTIEDITERRRSELRLKEAHQRLLETSRFAGMAEIATNVLHNVGNVLNSVNVSANLVLDALKNSRTAGFARVATLLREQRADLPGFFASERGRQLPDYVAQLADYQGKEQETLIGEVGLLRQNIDHIKEIVAMQQTYAKVAGVIETVDLGELVEDSLRMNIGALARHQVALERAFEPVPPITLDKHKVLQILVNLVRNAKYACDESNRTDRKVTLRVWRDGANACVAVSDNGVGIAPENMARLFRHGFTTRKLGHGFGLHSGALAAKEMGGRLHAHSDGPGAGATFTLELPLNNSNNSSPHPPTPAAADAGSEAVHA